MAQIITPQNPFIFRDMRQGRYAPYSVSEYLAPANSVSFSRNVNFDTIVGKAVVRKGTTLVGATVASNKTPLGLAEFVGLGGSPNYIMSAFSGASNATVYYWNGTSWTATNKTGLSNTKLNRFATLGGSVFFANGTDGMFDSSDGVTFGTTNSIGTVKPSLVYRYNATLLCAGDATYPSRVWFSSVISPAASPFITWSVNATTGNWIDINPDDGGQMVGFAETSSFLLAFKSNGMYRLDTIAKSTSPQNIFNIGAQSQEGIVACQGLVYFFSGIDIRQTDGGFPVQISRVGVQDIIDAIPQANWAAVAAGTDGINVYFSIGTVTLNTNTEFSRTLTNCVLKWSPRDQSWSVHTYGNVFSFFTLFTDSTNGRVMRGSTTAGDVQSLNVGTTDNTVVINYELETQDIDFGDRSHLKGISKQIAVFTKNGQDSLLSCKVDDDFPKPIPIENIKRVNIGKDIDLQGHYFRFLWYGEAGGTSPVFEGFSLESVTDLGQT